MRILSGGQGAILSRGSLKARVTVSEQDRRCGYRPGAGAILDLRPAPVRRLTRSRSLSFAHSGSKLVELPLTAAGKAAIRSCEARTLQVRAGRGRGTASLVRDSAACKPKQIDLSRASECDFIGQQSGSMCLLPFPDDFYSVADSSTATGRRINLQTGAMPANVSDVHIDAAPYDRNDGFSPGQPIVLRVPGLDTPTALANTGAVPINHLGRYRAKNAPVVVIDAKTGKRWPIWVEIDSNAATPAKTALLIHPATNFAAKHRYIVALRNLKDDSGKTIAAPEGFRYYRDDLPSKKAAINKQRRRFERVFKDLRSAGIERSDLYLAWDFTVASDLNIAARMLHIRNDAFAQLGDTNLADGVVSGSAPAFSVDTVDIDPKPGVARRVRGHIHRPLLPVPELRAGRPLPARLRRHADAKRRLDRQLRLCHPAFGDRRCRRGAGTPGGLRSRAVRQRSTRSTAPTSSTSSGSTTTSCSARPTRSGCREPTCRTPSCTSCPTSRTGPSWPTASSRGCSTSSSSAA